MQNQELKEQYMLEAEQFIIANRVPFGADAAFYAGVEYGLNLREQEINP